MKPTGNQLILVSRDELYVGLTGAGTKASLLPAELLVIRLLVGKQQERKKIQRLL